MSGAFSGVPIEISSHILETVSATDKCAMLRVGPVNAQLFVQFNNVSLLVNLMWDRYGDFLAEVSPPQQQGAKKQRIELSGSEIVVQFPKRVASFLRDMKACLNRILTAHIDDRFDDGKQQSMLALHMRIR